MLSNKIYRYFVLLSVFIGGSFLLSAQNNEIPKLNMGMNLDSYSYYTRSLLFVDVMKSASDMMTFNAQGESPWNTEKINKIKRDPQGYPLELPVAVDNGPPQAVRFLINNVYSGDYVFLYDGEGEFDFSLPNSKDKGKIILHLDGKGDNRWINIKKSQKGNHVRNIRILPADDSFDPKLPFYPLYVEGIAQFHCLRFMDLLGTNGSNVTTWETRVQPDYYSQGTDKGVAIEYAIQLSNQLKCDAWFCIPHKADDQYIHKFAQLVHDTLDPNLKVYIEYSNEIWNWQFGQAHYVLENAPGAIDQYVSDKLKGISPKQENHPEKDAYMMQRVFRIWSDVFGDSQKQRLVRVAAVQHAWVDNTKRILQYLFKFDENGKPLSGPIYKDSEGHGCDVVAPGGYFSYSDADKNKWQKMDPSQVTPEVILKGVDKSYSKEAGAWTLDTAKYARTWKVGYVVYEGGQHITPFDQKDTPYNQAIWDAQINPMMYDLYMKLFRTHASPEVDCKLFCAFAYVSERKSRWGSWGHLERLDQLHNLSNIKLIAPKFAAVIDANIQR